MSIDSYSDYKKTTIVVLYNIIDLLLSKMVRVCSIHSSISMVLQLQTLLPSLMCTIDTSLFKLFTKSAAEISKDCSSDCSSSAILGK